MALVFPVAARCDGFHDLRGGAPAFPCLPVLSIHGICYNRSVLVTARNVPNSIQPSHIRRTTMRNKCRRSLRYQTLSRNTNVIFALLNINGQDFLKFRNSPITTKANVYRQSSTRLLPAAVRRLAFSVLAAAIMATSWLSEDGSAEYAVDKNAQVNVSVAIQILPDCHGIGQVVTIEDDGPKPGSAITTLAERSGD